MSPVSSALPEKSTDHGKFSDNDLISLNELWQLRRRKDRKVTKSICKIRTLHLRFLGPLSSLSTSRSTKHENCGTWKVVVGEVKLFIKYNMDVIHRLNKSPNSFLTLLFNCNGGQYMNSEGETSLVQNF